MKYWKRAANALQTAAAIGMLAAPAAAQPAQGPSRIPQASRAVPRTTPVQHEIVSRQQTPIPNWQQFRAGVPVRSRGFSVSVFYSSGVPFYGGIPGYIYSNTWFPGWCGPRPMFRSDIEYLQWANISRFGPTVWEARAIRNGIPPYAPDWYRQINPSGYDRTTDSIINQQLQQELEDTKRQLREYELQDAEKRGYERGLSERMPEPAQLAPSQTPLPIPAPKDKTYHFGYAENSAVCPDQYQSEGNRFLNQIFEDVSQESNRRLHAYTYSKNKKPYTAVVDLQNSVVVLTEDYSVFNGRVPKPEEFVSKLDKDLNILGIQRIKYRDNIVFLNHVPRCGPQ